MSVIERSQSFVKDMNELNVSGVSQYFQIQREALEGFVSANRDRFAALRDVKGIGDVVSVEREYYAAVQKGFSSSVERQTSLARDNWSTAGQLVRGLFGNQADSAGDKAADEAVAEVA